VEAANAKNQGFPSFYFLCFRHSGAPKQTERVLALLLPLISPLPRVDWQLRPLGSTQKLLEKAPGKLEAWTPRPEQLDCVRGEHTEFQFVISAGGQSIGSLSVKSTPLATYDARFIAPANLRLFRENFAFVKHPSGNRITAPKWWPDALVPLSLASQKIEANESAVFWASLSIPADAAPGDYFGELDIQCNGQPKRLALAIHVRPLSLPPSHFRATVALYYDVLRDWYRKDGRVYSNEEWDGQKRRYADFLLDFGLNPYNPPYAWNDPRLDGYLQNPRVHSVRTPPLDSPDFALALEAFKRTGTLQKAFYYWNDEPRTSREFGFIQGNAAKLRPLHIPQLVTHAPTSQLQESVDIWCPNVSNALGSGHLDFSSLLREQKAGHPTWLYTMVVPKHPYPTWLLDDDSSALESYAPLWSRIGASGFVYSMCHGWGPHPLENLESFEGTNGDGTLLYPAELAKGVGPMPSIRLILLRDAIEDLSLWNEAKARNLAPAFSFPANRKGALVYNRTALLDALESGRRVRQMPILAPQLWPQTPTKRTFTAPFSQPLGAGRSASLQWKGERLKVRLIGPQLREGEEVTVTLAPVDIQNHLVKQRIRWNAKGATLDELRSDGATAPDSPIARVAGYVQRRQIMVDSGKELPILLSDCSLPSPSYLILSLNHVSRSGIYAGWGGNYVNRTSIKVDGGGNYAGGGEIYGAIRPYLPSPGIWRLSPQVCGKGDPLWASPISPSLEVGRTRSVLVARAFPKRDWKFQPVLPTSREGEMGDAQRGSPFPHTAALEEQTSTMVARPTPIQILTSTPSTLLIQIPANSIRFNVSLRSDGKTVRFFPDGGDPFAMPILQRPNV